MNTWRRRRPAELPLSEPPCSTHRAGPTAQTEDATSQTSWQAGWTSMYLTYKAMGIGCADAGEGWEENHRRHPDQTGSGHHSELKTKQGVHCVAWANLSWSTCKVERIIPSSVCGCEGHRAGLSEWQLSSDSEHNQEAGSEKGTEANPLHSPVTNLLCQGPGSRLYILQSTMKSIRASKN